jgi:hypothetical protein
LRSGDDPNRSIASTESSKDCGASHSHRAQSCNRNHLNGRGQ